MIKTNFHPVNKTDYEIITDQTDKTYINVLSKLANFNGGIVRCVNDFKKFKTKACFVAIALRKLTEQTVLNSWESLCGLDRDPQLDAYVSFLHPPNFSGLNA